MFQILSAYLQRGAFPDAFDEHFGTDVAEEGEGDPRDEPLERGEVVGDGVDADPADHGHCELEGGEGAGDQCHAGFFHVRFYEAAGEGD